MLENAADTGKTNTAATAHGQSRSWAQASSKLAPSTPRKRKAEDDLQAKPPATPEPSAVDSVKAPYSSGDIDHFTPPPKERQVRPVQPHMTIAPLQTPRGSRVIAFPSTSAAEVSPSITSEAQLTTKNLLETACAHILKVDPQLKKLVDQHYCQMFSQEGLEEEVDPFESLVSAIMSQQISGAAAKSIKAKFVGLFSENINGKPGFPTPAQVAATELTRLRLAGLSPRKAEYIKGLAEKFASGDLHAKMLAEASDEVILEKLTAVRGLGRWSVEMFACFALKRMDIFSTGDLGVQ